MRWAWRVAAVVAALVVIVGAALAIYAQRSLPEVDGTRAARGLPAEVRIERDAAGIPTIKGSTVEAALFGLGYAHAQDRLWQLETHRRIGSGRLAEAFGAAALESDRFLRALGVRRAAAAQWANASPEARRAILAYTAGVNAGIEALRARPPEFVIL